LVSEITSFRVVCVVRVFRDTPREEGKKRKAYNLAGATGTPLYNFLGMDLNLRSRHSGDAVSISYSTTGVAGGCSDATNSGQEGAP
jgi:hypothetical protein